MSAGYSNSSHSYLVLEDQPRSLQHGQLVELSGLSIKNAAPGYQWVFHSHSGYMPLVAGGVIQDISLLVPLDQEKCDLLDAILTNEGRYAVYSTPGLLEWALELKVGDIVQAKLPKKRGPDTCEHSTAAVIRWKGKVDDGYGTRHVFGVEITVSNFGNQFVDINNSTYRYVAIVLLPN